MWMPSMCILTLPANSFQATPEHNLNLSGRKKTLGYIAWENFNRGTSNNLMCE